MRTFFFNVYVGCVINYSSGNKSFVFKFTFGIFACLAALFSSAINHYTAFAHLALVHDSNIQMHCYPTIILFLFSCSFGQINNICSAE